MREVLESARELRAFVADQHDPGSPAAGVAERVRYYLEHASAGVTLDETLGLKPGRGKGPWWRAEQRRRSREAITWLRALVPAASYRFDAEAIRAVAARYRKGHWGLYTDQPNVPGSEPPRAALHALLFAIGGENACRRNMKRAIDDCDTILGIWWRKTRRRMISDGNVMLVLDSLSIIAYHNVVARLEPLRRSILNRRCTER